ncbi:hypothetical protein [Marinomonas primoryensis]|jgi:hypothetical protein|uniref:hypothetical protein n=1 Tax=Marinomonas primoryensis TaxID=178399 RepID=UPI00370479E8
MKNTFSWFNVAIKCCLVFLALLYQFTITGADVANLLNENELINTKLILVLGSIIYAILLAVPYFPGIEVGLAIMIIFGTKGVIFAYLATVLGLFVAFLLGGRIKDNRLLNNKLSKIIVSETTHKLSNYAPMLALIILLNMPGNIVLGGGGGIAMSYGYYKKLSPLKFLFSLIIATSPIPLLIGILGVQFPL